MLILAEELFNDLKTSMERMLYSALSAAFGKNLKLTWSVACVSGDMEVVATHGFNPLCNPS
jgi:hypothetical protein